MRPRPLSSVRSRQSNSTATTSAVETKGKCGDYCRKFVAFMCTQVGVGALIVGYALIGAASFQSIETQPPPGLNLTANATRLRDEYSRQLWRVMDRGNVFNKTQWNIDANAVLERFQSNFTALVKRGYDHQRVEDKWSYPAALMYSMSVFSMIGYGNLVPKTPWGKGATVIYATFGIPLYILYFLNIGRVLARSFKALYRWFHACSHDPFHGDEDAISSVSQQPPKKVIVPSTAGLWVICIYVAGGTIMFTKWEGWEFLDSVYFCVTSLCKIGFGDFVPGVKASDSEVQKQVKLAINFCYMLFGMGLVAMCYNLMKEEVRVKMAEMKEDMRLCMEDIQKRFTGCCGGAEERERQRRRKRRRLERELAMDMEVY